MAEGRYYTINFPIGEGKTDYEKYLKTQTLLSLQKTNEEAASPEELLFQVTHQSSELWMKLAMHELDRVLEAFEMGDFWQANRLMERVHAIQKILLQSVDFIARHITVKEYEHIRLALGQGSGMESPGFNGLLEYPAPLWQAFKKAQEASGLSLKDLYNNYQDNLPLFTMAEHLMEFDDLFHKWRNHHVDLVTRTIGIESKSLKGLSSEVLNKGARHRFFPELLQVRCDITNDSSVAYGGAPLKE